LREVLLFSTGELYRGIAQLARATIIQYESGNLACEKTRKVAYIAKI